MRWGVIEGLAALAMMAATTSAQAQVTPTFVFRSDVQGKCLFGDDGPPLSFPEGAASGAGGVVRTRLVFLSADAPPRVEVFTDTAGSTFSTAVRADVAKYRIKCPELLGQPLIQEHQFVPESRTVLTRRMRASRNSWDRSSCKSEIPPTPDYPVGTPKMAGAPSVIDKKSYGRVLLRLTFNGPGEPGVIVIHDGGNRRFVETATEHASRYRMTCADAASYPVVATVPYSFLLAGDQLATFKPISLTAFLKAVENIDQQRVYFDLNSMGCPFEMSIYPLQPTYDNIINGASDRYDDRLEFFSWLQSLVLRLPPDAAQDLKGSAIKVSVPCAVLNLL